MGASGTTTVNFGSFPGATEAYVDITGQGSIVSGSLVEAWLRPVATGDHSEDEHLAVSPFLKVIAHGITGATGFRITAIFAPQIPVEPDLKPPLGRGTGTGANTGPGQRPPGQSPDLGGDTIMLTGQWTVAWVWN